MTVHSCDISVCICGPVDENTEDTIAKFKKYLPNSQVILSTWKGLKGDYSCDELVLNDDPGAEILEFTFANGVHYQKAHNINRMILSRQKALNAAKNKYTLLLRSDFSIENTNFLKYFEKFPCKEEKYSQLAKRVIVYPSNTDKEYNGVPLLFHVSDMCYFGLTQDLHVLYDLELVKEPEFTKYFLFNKIPTNVRTFGDNRTWKMSGEQYVTSSLAIKNRPEIEFKNWLDYNDESINYSHKFIMNNFIILDQHQWGVYSNREEIRNSLYEAPFLETKNKYRYYTFKREYCKIHNLRFIEIDIFNLIKTKYKLKKMYENNFKKIKKADGKREIYFMGIKLFSYKRNEAKALVKKEIKFEKQTNKSIPNIRSVNETLECLIKSKASFVRFGDGELQLINECDIPFQKASKELSARLKEVLSSDDKSIFIGIPHFIYHSKENLIDLSKNFWRNNGKNFREIISKYINNKIQYYAAETTIAFNAYKKFDAKSYFEKISKIWKNNDITIVCGETVFDKIDYNIFDCAKSVEYQYVPSMNAFDDYDTILKHALEIDQKRIVIAIIGPAAKVLCYDLAKQGYQALDLGHIAKSYDWWKKNKSTYKMADAVDFFNPD